MGPQTSELIHAPAGLKVEVLQDDSCSMADTAALMHGLDLVITVDTLVAHLAGALARPVWLILPYAADWRWGRGEHGSALYPTMRLFRQARAADWEGLFEAVRQSLIAMVTPSMTTPAEVELQNAVDVDASSCGRS
jgi:hypothetical protein